MRAILLLLDGLGDKPSPELGNLTPLQAARKPHLNRLAAGGCTGILVPYRQGVPLGTEVAHLLLWGYSLEDFPGRGYIEALGEGLPVEEGAVYLRASLAVVRKEERGFYILGRRPSRKLTPQLVEEFLSSLPQTLQGYSFRLHYTGGIDFILEIKGEVSDKISESDPFADGVYVLKVKPVEDLCSDQEEEEKALATSRALNEYLLKAHGILENLGFPANFLLSKWAGRARSIPSFKEKWGLRGVVLAQTPLFRGLARYVGMDFIRISSLAEGIRLLPQLEYDFIHLHTKATDDAAHTKNPENKVKAIEEIDSLLGEMVLNQGDLLIITGDHSTPSVGTLIHSGDTVPILFFGPNVRVDEVKEFDEISCSQGHLRLEGKDLLPVILNHLDRALLYGLRLGERITPYIPCYGELEPLLPED
ncbi:MAG TPA: 2,3-bisphosphoglycerate-independent phosphoglycerate mutase [Moorella mulderi]|nr:2,3-bisphosphoglycerate-independent phosphoglycerate mutase [Moorella mulderi]